MAKSFSRSAPIPPHLVSAARAFPRETRAPPRRDSRQNDYILPEMTSKEPQLESWADVASAPGFGHGRLPNHRENLPPTERAEVVRFAFRPDAERMLGGDDIGVLAQRMIDATAPLEKLTPDL